MERNLLIFQVAGELCAFPVEAVREILPMAALARSPGQLPILEGFLNLRGAAVPVLRLDRLFGYPAREPGLYTPLVLLGGRAPLALLVDGVLAMEAVASESIMPVPANGSFNNCLEAEFVLDGRTVHVLSPERILLEQERRRIAEFQAAAERRLQQLDGPPA